MPPPMRYPEKLLVRLPKGTRKRIETQQAEGEALADTQRRVILSGLEGLEASASEKPSTKRASQRSGAAKTRNPIDDANEGGNE